MPEYQKLVRDGIPRIIKEAGETPIIRILNPGAEFIGALVTKVTEETAELDAAETREDRTGEAADLKELKRALDEEGIEDESLNELLASLEVELGAQEIEVARQKKFDERGGFDERIFLERTEP